MSKPRRRYSLGRKLLITLLIILLLAGAAFHIFITRYLTPMVQQRLENVIVKGSDSLYRLEMGKFDVSFWGGSIRFTDLHIRIDSVRYKRMEDEKRLPGVTLNLDLQKGNVEGIGIWALVFSKKINIQRITFQEADVQLARHFRQADVKGGSGEPLWKLIQPDIKSIIIGAIRFANLKVNYRNIDSAKSFRWQFDKCNAVFNDLRVDSTAAHDSTRLLFAKDMALRADSIKMNTPDGLYNLSATNIAYSSAGRSIDVKEFKFLPAISDAQFNRHFGYQHELYKLNMPSISIRNFQLSQWIAYNRLLIDTIKLGNPYITVHMDRNAPPNPYSKKGSYPHQLLQRAPFTINVRNVYASNGTVTYTEKNDKNQLTGKVLFTGVQGAISNITNDTTALRRSTECVVDVRSGLMQTGKVHTVFRFNLADKNGAFSVKANITKLNAAQLSPLFKAMTSTDLQSFDLHLIDYSISGNENGGTGKLRMTYDNMDILLNRVEGDKSLNKRGFLSFLVNRLVIYKENPKPGDDERVVESISVQRDAQKSFFNFIWKTLYTAAGQIVLRPVVQRKMEKRKERALRKAAAK